MEDAVKTLFEINPSIALIVLIVLVVYQILTQTFSFLSIRKDIKKHDKKFDRIEAILVDHSNNFERIDVRFERVEDKIEEQKAQTELRFEEVKTQIESLRKEVNYKLELQDKKIDLQNQRFAEQDKRIDLHTTLKSLDFFRTDKKSKTKQTQPA